MNIFKDLDPVLHSQLRLAIISLLMREKESEFTDAERKNPGKCGKPQCSNQ